MLSCHEICKSLSKFEGEQVFKLENYNPLFEQSADFSKNYLQLVEDKIKENGWVDPNLEPIKFQNVKAKEKEEFDDSKNNIDDKKGLQYTFLNYKEHQTNELPHEFLELVDSSRRSEIYYYGMKGPDSYLAAVLLGADPNYWLQHRKKKKEYADQIRTTFSIQKYDILRGLSKESIGYDYLTTIYSNDFPEHIDSDKSKEYQFLIGYYYKVNILIINLKELKGYFTTDWDPKMNTIVMFIDNNTYLPILSNKISYFTVDEIKKLENTFNIMYPTKINGNVTVCENKTDEKTLLTSKGKIKLSKRDDMITNVDQIQIKTIVTEQFHPISKYQLKNLQDIADKLQLPTEITKTSPDGKKFRIIKKLKQELYDDILAKIASLGNSN